MARRIRELEDTYLRWLRRTEPAVATLAHEKSPVFLGFRREAPTGVEPVYWVLQTHA
jgi:hypothetical protein